MLEFKIIKRSQKSGARVGVLKTPHGEVETPAFVPVATRATVRTLDTREVAEAGAQMLICNTYHLHLAPGEKIVKRMGGIHGYMNWKRPLMTDSGGFQVFSLGFGSDHGMGKMLREKNGKIIDDGMQPKKVRITEDGAHFRSPIDGTELFLGPKESMRIQESLGADIMFAFDECPSPVAGDAYLTSSLERTHRWAKVCIDAKRTEQALYGIVQGGANKAMRAESADILAKMEFDGFGLGGEFGYHKRGMAATLRHTLSRLPEEKPRHVLGVGHPEDFAIIARGGGDTFDCIAPTHYARRGTAFTSTGRVDLGKRMHLSSQKALDARCSCEVCTTYSRSYLAHLIRAHELSGMKLLTMHNLFYFNALAARIRRQIKDGKL